jgi:hypothetical protein
MNERALSTGIARVFALGLGLGFGVTLGANVILAGGNAPDEQQIQRRVEATATAIRKQAQARAMATAVAKATATATRDTQNAARCADARGAQVDAALVGEPGISYTTYGAAGTVRNLCHYPLDVKLHILAETQDGQQINAIVDEQPMRLPPGESRAFAYPLGRFPNASIAELYVVPSTRVP